MSTDTRTREGTEPPAPTERDKGAATARLIVHRQIEAGQAAEQIADRWEAALAGHDPPHSHAGAAGMARRRQNEAAQLIQDWRDMQREEAEQAQAARDAGRGKTGGATRPMPQRRASTPPECPGPEPGRAGPPASREEPSPSLNPNLRRRADMRWFWQAKAPTAVYELTDGQVARWRDGDHSVWNENRKGRPLSFNALAGRERAERRQADRQAAG